MPRETIVQPQAAAQPVVNGAGTPLPEGHREVRPGLHVGWNKAFGGWVQISTVPHGWESTADWAIVDLDDAQVTHLIRVLRRAQRVLRTA